ncbi:unnamed protein product [Linum trigynum]|uniref:Uncharacterized protein n=1 Tax=Linum trigynum TaxID=586398 RepID=A0AAV2CHW5_9ROSI
MLSSAAKKPSSSSTLTIRSEAQHWTPFRLPWRQESVSVDNPVQEASLDGDAAAEEDSGLERDLRCQLDDRRLVDQEGRGGEELV